MKDPCFLSKSGIDLAASVREQIASQEKANQRAYLFELFFIHVRRVAGAIQTLNMTYAEMAGSDLFLALAACSDEGTIAPGKPIFLKGGFPYAELGGEGSRSTIPSRQHPGTLFASFGVAARRAIARERSEPKGGDPAY
jgi:hypothetical protein